MFCTTRSVDSSEILQRPSSSSFFPHGNFRPSSSFDYLLIHRFLPMSRNRFVWIVAFSLRRSLIPRSINSRSLRVTMDHFSSISSLNQLSVISRSSILCARGHIFFFFFFFYVTTDISTSAFSPLSLFLFFSSFSFSRQFTNRLCLIFLTIHVSRLIFIIWLLFLLLLLGVGQFLFLILRLSNTFLLFCSIVGRFSRQQLPFGRNSPILGNSLPFPAG